MNCIIIEDERHAVKHLENELALTGYRCNVLERIDSITDAVKWLKHNQADLIFLDVQLADGISFEIFDHIQIKTPVIFTTSYNQYITKAFEVNSISYLLKPVDADSLKLALQKFDFLYNPTEEDASLNAKIVSLNTEYQKRFIVNVGSKILTIPAEEAAYFKVENKRFLIMTTKNRQQNLIDTTMEMLERRVDPSLFFRINRQYIINIHAIKEMHRLDNGRIKIDAEPPCKEELIVSGDRASDFKHWLNR
jgi:DNA-binding LytR/AlgR family response regulator